MTLQQAMRRLSDEGMWLRPYAGNPRWVVWIYGPTGFKMLGRGATWQEAYANAMNEAPY